MLNKSKERNSYDWSGACHLEFVLLNSKKIKIKTFLINEINRKAMINHSKKHSFD